MGIVKLFYFQTAVSVKYKENEDAKIKHPHFSYLQLGSVNFYKEIQKNDKSKRYAINSKGFKVVLFDEIDEEADGYHRYDK